VPDDISDIRAFYDKNVEKEHGRLERHPIERDVTWRYLDTYLPPAGKILDIGAGTGAYTIPLAKRGYSVTAADLSTALIDACEKRVREAALENKVTCIVADARDLSKVTEADFDAVLLMGPLYHLILEEDRKIAVKEAFNRLKPGGIIFSSFISRYGIWGDVMKNLPNYIEKQEDLKFVLERGRDAELPAWEASFRAYFATVSETIPLHEQQGFKTLVVAGVEPAGIAADETYQGLTDMHRKLWLDLLFNISKEESIVGASCHLLYIGRK
jgi:S-adenosylmethionine-dependent methyltransferase